MTYAAAAGSSSPYTISPYNAAAVITSGVAGLNDTSGTVNYSLSGGGGTLTGAVSANTLQFTGADNTITAPGTFSLSLKGIMNTGLGTATIAGGSLIAGDSRELIFTGPGNVTISAAIPDNGSGASALTMAGGGTLLLAGANTYSGDTTVDSGVLILGSSAALQQSTLVTRGSGALSFGTLNSATIGGLTGTGPLGLINTSSGVVTLSAGNNTANSTYSGTLYGPGGLNKIGAGTLLLTGSNTYSGTTAVNQGELVVNGSLTSPVTVNSGGKLAGTGNLSSVTINSGGHIAPGNSPGILTLSGTLSLLSGAVMDYELATPLNSDEVYMPTSLLSLNGQQFSDFNFTPLGGFGPGTYTLVDAGSVSGGLGASTSGFINGWPANLGIQGNDLVLTVVPEPGTTMLVLVGGLCLLGYLMRSQIYTVSLVTAFTITGVTRANTLSLTTSETGTVTIPAGYEWTDVTIQCRGGGGESCGGTYGNAFGGIFSEGGEVAAER
jgi:autotransporter-associated beta strand protein